MIRLASAGVGGLLLIAAAPAPHLYREGPPPGFSGGFGESSCWACHFSGEENEAPGELVIGGVPETYVAGETYPLVVTLRREGMAAAGFQLTARFEDGGEQAGSLKPAEADRAAVAADREVEYAFQLDAGAEPQSPDSATWTVLWTAPDEAGTVRLNVAANAADGDGTAEGDRVYTATAVLGCASRSSGECDTAPSVPSSRGSAVAGAEDGCRQRAGDDTCPNTPQIGQRLPRIRAPGSRTIRRSPSTSRRR